jgi:hypothetical protein
MKSRKQIFGKKDKWEMQYYSHPSIIFGTGTPICAAIVVAHCNSR